MVPYKGNSNNFGHKLRYSNLSQHHVLLGCYYAFKKP